MRQVDGAGKGANAVPRPETLAAIIGTLVEAGVKFEAKSAANQPRDARSRCSVISGGQFSRTSAMQVPAPTDV